MEIKTKSTNQKKKPLMNWSKINAMSNTLQNTQKENHND